MVMCHVVYYQKIKLAVPMAFNMCGFSYMYPYTCISFTIEMIGTGYHQKMNQNVNSFVVG